jgi:hypothetical protein
MCHDGYSARFVTISVAISVTLPCRFCFLLLLLLLLLIASLAAAFTASPSAAPVVAHCCSNGYYSYLLLVLLQFPLLRQVRRPRLPSPLLLLPLTRSLHTASPTAAPSANPSGTPTAATAAAPIAAPTAACKVTQLQLQRLVYLFCCSHC